MAGPFWATQAAQKAGIEGPIRKVLWKCYQHGRQIIQGVFQKGEVASAKPNKDPLRAQFEAPRVEIKGPVILPKGSQTPIKPNSLGGLVYRANIQTFAGQLRKKAALQFLGGNFSRNAKHTPIFAFVSLALSAGQSFEKKDDPTENVFAQIREMFKPGTANGPDEETGNDLPCEIGLDDLEFGKMINKGCNAAVYEARLKPAEGESEISWAELSSPGEVQGENYVIETSLNTDQEQGETTLLDIDSDEMKFDDSDISIISHVETEGTWLDIAEDGDMAVFSIAPVLTEDESNSLADGDLDHDPDNGYDLAVKMMFNYDVESNSEAILRAMEKETVPARSRFKQGTSPMWENGSHVKKKRDLPPHPNIVDMRSVFVGCVPLLEDALTQFPDALPTLYNPEGFGRNQTMFLVMKKYSHTLREYLSREDHLSLRSSLLLYVQLLEGVVHMVQHGIAHRDLKSDNILVEAGGDNSPHLVISDFGCCLAEEGGLKMPYLSEEMFRGGNRALMAPEIAGAVPGNSSTLEYSQSDVWAAGALGYEIFGGGNPFYRGQTNQRLDSLTYSEDQLPTLDGEIPEPIRQLVKSLLNRDPKQRPIPEVAANLIHILLWASDDWLSGKRPSREDVTQWLLTMAAKVLCQEKVRVGRSRCFRQPSKVAGTWPDVEYQLVKTFLSRVRVDEIMEAVEML